MHLTLLLDAARLNDAIVTARELNAKHRCLYELGKNDLLEPVAPYVFAWAGPGAFADFYRESGWGQSWGLLVRSQEDYTVLHRHFRRFLEVSTEEGERLYFRFYDPRVLRVFLPTCSLQQLRDFFGPIDAFLVESEDPATALEFRLGASGLQVKELPAASIFPVAAERAAPVSAPITEASGVSLPGRPAPPKPGRPKWNMLD